MPAEVIDLLARIPDYYYRQGLLDELADWEARRATRTSRVRRSLAGLLSAIADRVAP